MALREEILSAMRAAAEERLSPKRMRHTAGVEDTAAKMAERLGLSSDGILKVRAAAILHDITKECTADEQLALCSRFSLPLTAHDRAAPDTLHAITGAAYARFLFPEDVDDEIYGMIRYHTTGKENMTAEEKILFLADYMEPGRSYPACRALYDRFFGGDALDDCTLSALEQTLRYVTEKGGCLHPASLAARDFLLLHQK